MKVVQLSTHDVRGGAAAAAWRLHGVLRDQGIDSRMVVRTRHRDDPHVAATDEGGIAVWHEEIITPWLRRQGPEDLPWFTIGATDLPLETHPWIVEADVLHLHWVSEWLSASTVRRLASLGKPIVWTFHDLWPVTGGVHYAGTNTPQGDEWQRGSTLPEPLRAISRREFDRKLTAWADLPIHVVSPSQWLGSVVKSSAIGSRWSVQTMANGIDTGVFLPGDRAAARARWGIPAEATVLLFGCAALGDRRKGFAQLQEALRSAPREGVSLVLFGGDAVVLDYPHQLVGSVRDPAAMASLYQAADAFLSPALEDNLPTTVIESLACGTPVIGFATGGVPDLVEDGRTGLLAPCGDVPALADCLQRFMNDAGLRSRLADAARSADKSRFSLQTHASKTIEMYRARTAPAAEHPLPEMAQGPLPFTLLNEEMLWLQSAAVDAVLQARQREHNLRDKLQAAKSKLDKARAPKAPTPTPAKDKPWWKLGS
ncbi:MAG: glycosyltransferase [Verrucomicrobiaceae bacterium]|nr:glycosyltransferase [Verrucomicrobiaceae bacterium]